MVEVFLGEHYIRHGIGIPPRLPVFFNPSLRENVVDVFAGGFAEPGVVHLHDTVVLQVPGALGDEQAEDGF